MEKGNLQKEKEDSFIILIASFANSISYSCCVSIMDSRSPFFELPVEILLDNILPVLSTPGLLTLGCTNKACSFCHSLQLISHTFLKSSFSLVCATTKRYGAGSCSQISTLRGRELPGLLAGNSSIKTFTNPKVKCHFASKSITNQYVWRAVYVWG